MDWESLLFDVVAAAEWSKNLPDVSAPEVWQEMCHVAAEKGVDLESRVKTRRLTRPARP